jgi:hypothetical protein
MKVRSVGAKLLHVEVRTDVMNWQSLFAFLRKHLKMEGMDEAYKSNKN